MTSPISEEPISVAIYDLDGVITTRDSFTAFIVEQLRRAPRQLVRALPAAAAMLVCPGEKRRRLATARVVTIALAGLRDHDYAELAAVFGKRIGSDPAWMRASTVERIRRQKAQGKSIIIATATERQLAEYLLARAQVPYDLLSASLLAERPTGMEAADHRIGARKAEALREQGVVIEEAEFVTDSISDLPTARLAAQVTLIGASRKTQKLYARAGIAVADPTD